MKGTKEDDGDYQFNLALEQQYRKLLNQENFKQVNGMLVKIHDTSPSLVR